MTDVREHPVRDSAAHATAVGEYRRDGYQIADDAPGETELCYQHGGSALTHLAIFFTIGWLTFGLVNWWYARRRKKRTRDRVRVVTQS